MPPDESFPNRLKDKGLWDTPSTAKPVQQPNTENNLAPINPFALQDPDSYLADLQNQNIHLRAQKDTLEGEVSELRHQLEVQNQNSIDAEICAQVNTMRTMILGASAAAILTYSLMSHHIQVLQKDANAIARAHVEPKENKKEPPREPSAYDELTLP